MEIKKQALTSASHSEFTLEALKQIAPSAFTEVRGADGELTQKVNFDVLRELLGDAIADADEESFGFQWVGKQAAKRAAAEPTRQTLRPVVEDSVDWDTTENLYIEGDNLEVLKLLQRAYLGKVKMIYIDPPYNTGNDFIYNDDFKQTRRSYETEAGIIDDEGNVVRDDGLRTNTGGHKHSNWLNMMYPRLFLARNLLRQDGVIFVSIDDNEVHNLRLMMNEIFGEENFVGNISWRRFNSQANIGLFATVKDHILIYARDLAEIRFGRIPLTSTAKKEYQYKDERGVYARRPCIHSVRGHYKYDVKLPNGDTLREHWMIPKEVFDDENKRGLIHWPQNGGNPMRKIYLDDAVESGQIANDFWGSEFGNNKNATEEIKTLFDNKRVFDFPKPSKLIKNIISLGSPVRVCNSDIILDFFSGSGTTAHAVAELNAEDGGNRHWICVQLPELTDEKSEAYKAGYRTIADIARERIRRAGAKIRADRADKLASRNVPLDLGFRAYRVGDSNFKQWNELASDSEEIRQQALANLDPLEEGTTDDDLLTELLLKRGISPLAQIDQHDDFCFIPSEKLAICLAHSMTEELFATILATKPSSIILLDRAFGDDVNLKVNLLLQAERQGVEVEVV